MDLNGFLAAVKARCVNIYFKTGSVFKSNGLHLTKSFYVLTSKSAANDTAEGGADFPPVSPGLIPGSGDLAVCLISFSKVT